MQSQILKVKDNGGKKAVLLTVLGLGSSILLISAAAPWENQGGHEKKAAFICNNHTFGLIIPCHPLQSATIDRQTTLFSSTGTCNIYTYTGILMTPLGCTQPLQCQLTFLYNVGRSASSNGRYPAIKTKRMTPQDHTSAAAPSYPWLLITYS